MNVIVLSMYHKGISIWHEPEFGTPQNITEKPMEV